MNKIEVKIIENYQGYHEAAILIANVYDEASVKEFDGDWNNPQQKFVGIWNNSNLIGLGGYAFSPATNHIVELNWAVILPEYRGQGFGKKLLDARIELSVKEAQIKKIQLNGWIVSSLPSSLYLSKGGIKLIKTTEDKYLIFIPYAEKC